MTGGLLGRVLRAPAWLYRWHCGWLLGHRFLLLVHTGRRTGRRHSTVLEVVEYRREPLELVVMSGFGRNSAWLRNLAAGRDAEIVVAMTRFAAAWRELGEAEAAAVMAGYERRNRLAAPLVRLVLSRLVGWRYDGSDAARRRLVRALPLIAFRRAAGGDAM
jgi:deazaflavin-dependent oxidoreductase (nitroreductase family)